MGWDLHIYGGFNISPYLALKVFDIFDQITAEAVDPSLSHTDDDDCPTCKAAGERERQEEVESGTVESEKVEDPILPRPSGSPALDKEKNDDAADADRPGHQWVA